MVTHGRSRHLVLVGVVLSTLTLPLLAQRAPFREPPPPGQRIQARDGDIVVVENDDRVRVVRQRQSVARVVVDQTARAILVLVDFAGPQGQGPPDGLVDRSSRVGVLGGEWPLDARWEGHVTFEEYLLSDSLPGGGFGLVTPRGLVQFVSGPGSFVQDAGAVAVISVGSMSGSGGGRLSFDQAEQEQLAMPVSRGVTNAFTTTFSSEIVTGSMTSSVSARAPGAVPSAGAPVRVGGNVRPPAKIRHVEPAMPEQARAARVQGMVILELTIAADGSVQDARVLRSIPLLDQPAVEAARQWLFEPTQLNGQAVPVIMNATVEFRY